MGGLQNIQKFSECVCCLSYPVCTAQALHYMYIVIYDLSGCNMYLLTLSHQEHVFLGGRGKVTEHKTCVLILSTTFVSNISVPHQHKCTSVSCKVLVISVGCN